MPKPSWTADDARIPFLHARPMVDCSFHRPGQVSGGLMRMVRWSTATRRPRKCPCIRPSMIPAQRRARWCICTPAIRRPCRPCPGRNTADLHSIDQADGDQRRSFLRQSGPAQMPSPGLISLCSNRKRDSPDPVDAALDQRALGIVDKGMQRPGDDDLARVQTTAMVANPAREARKCF
jgi:hypothetical protein